MSVCDGCGASLEHVMADLCSACGEVRALRIDLLIAEKAWSACWTEWVEQRVGDRLFERHGEQLGQMAGGR